MSTTKDPLRLVLDPSCPDAERELLSIGARLEPPPGAEARVWQALAGTIAAAAVAGSAADASSKTAAATSTSAGLTTAKIVAAVIALATLVGLVALGRYLISPAKDPRPPASVAIVPGGEAPATPAPPAPPSAATAPSWPDEVPPPPPPVEANRTRPARRAPPAPSPQSHLRQETTLIREARQALRGGDSAQALRLLDECRRLFPTGVLEQERERLAIEALVADGRAAEASARAGEFLRKYPDSPHASEVRTLARSRR
jgi:hypothetical protein